MNFNKDNFISNDIYISWLGSIYINSQKEDFLRAIKSIEAQNCDYKQEIVIGKDGIIEPELDDSLKSYPFKINFKIIPIKSNQGLGQH